MNLAQQLAAHLTAEASNTRKMLAAVPEDRYEWQPHKKSMALGGLAGHLAETPSWMASMIPDELDFDAMMKEWTPYAPSGKEDLLATFDRHTKDALALLEGREDAFMLADWTMHKGGEVVMSYPRVEVMRTMILHHWIHHRGQLSVYLRLLDVPVPAIYGPSADEQP